MSDAISIFLVIDARFSTVWLCFCALVVDCVILVSVLYVIDWIGTTSSSKSLLIVLSVAIGLLGVVYHVILHGRYGQIVGKRVFCVKVVDVSEQLLIFAQTFR